jgi:hypothetical protein
MPANQRQPKSQTLSASPTQSTAKYTNKDGSKFIKVPKLADTPVMAQIAATNGQQPLTPTDTNGDAPAVNRKKQKRRQKQAAKLAAQPTNGAQMSGIDMEDGHPGEYPLEYGQYGGDIEGIVDEDVTYHSDVGEDGSFSGSYENDSPPNGYQNLSSNKSKKKKKNKGGQPVIPQHMLNGNASHIGNHGRLDLPPLQPNMPRGMCQTFFSRICIIRYIMPMHVVQYNSHLAHLENQILIAKEQLGILNRAVQLAIRNILIIPFLVAFHHFQVNRLTLIGPGISRERIWNTSSNEERERIKQYWLSLGEDERKSLVKVEKDAVLKKMKEQQRHSCSCTVCGRKRTAIEEELEVLYDAYYEELEQYANVQGMYS